MKHYKKLGALPIFVICILALSTIILQNNLPFFNMNWIVYGEAIYNNDICWLAVQQYNETSDSYVTLANWTSTGQSVRIYDGWVTRLLIEVKLNSTLAASEAEAESFTKVNMTISGDWSWTSKDLNQSSYKATYLVGSPPTGYYYVVKEGVRNQTGIPTAGTTYNGEATYQAYY